MTQMESSGTDYSDIEETEDSIGEGTDDLNKEGWEIDF